MYTHSPSSPSVSPSSFSPPQVPTLEIETTYTVVENGKTAYFDNGTRFSLFRFSLITSPQEFENLRKQMPFDEVRILCCNQDEIIAFESSAQQHNGIPNPIQNAFEICSIRWNEFKTEAYANIPCMIARAAPKFKFPKEVKVGNANI
jgi:hypothetical protein